MQAAERAAPKSEISMVEGPRLLLPAAAFAVAAFLIAPVTAMASQCTPVRVAVSKPSAAITVYSMLPKDTMNGELRNSGPWAIAIAPDGTVWFTLPESSAVGTLRDGKIERCVQASKAAADKAFTRATGASAQYTQPTIRAALPPGGMPFLQAVAPNGVTWFTLQYIGRDGNPTNAGRLGRIDAAGHLRIYAIPGSGEMVAIAIAKDGTIWLGDYYMEQMVKVDPAKL